MPVIGEFSQAASSAMTSASTELSRSRKVSAARLLAGLILFAGVGCGVGEDLSSAGKTSELAAETALRNVILLTMDTTRADALGAYGQVLPTTPRIDRMASEGLRFAQVVTSSPSTLPSHSSILTGKHPYAHGIRSNAGYVLAHDNVTLAEVLQRHGYRTAAEIAAPVLGRRTHLNQGFEIFRDTMSPGIQRKHIRTVTGRDDESIQLDERIASDITARGIQFLDSHGDDKFFLWLHYFDPHQTHTPPAEYRARLPGNPYHAEILYVDHEIGRLLDAVRSLGLKESTLVVLTADHGESLSEHDETDHSMLVYDSTMRAPLILWGPTILGEGSVVESLVRTVDIAPTVLDLLDLPPLADIQGVSLAPLITGEALDLHLTGYGESIEPMFFGASPIRFVREGEWKYLHKVNPELYNVREDPGELHNVAAENPKIVNQLRSKLEALIADPRLRSSSGTVPIDAATREQLQALGYLAAAPPMGIEETMASLELSGVDPLDVLDDFERMARATGAFRIQRYGEAIERFRYLWNKYHHAQFGLRIAESLIALGRFQEVSDLIEESLARSPSDSGFLTKLAYLIFQANHFDEAEKLLETILTRDRCFSKARVLAAYLAFFRRSYAEQIEILRIGAEECAGSSELRNLLAYALATSPDVDQRDGKRAVELALEIVENDPAPDAGHLDTLAAAFAEIGDFENAIAHSKRSIDLERRFGEISDVSAYRGHLERFEAHQPLRDPQPGS
jgi:arylsulfatase A-like enzyme